MVILNVPSEFFDKTAKSTGEIDAPIEVKVPMLVLAQIFGEITQAGTISSTNSVIKYSWSLKNDAEQSTVRVHFTKTVKVVMFGWATEVTDESVKANQNWYVRPVVKESFENIVILNELLAFLVRIANAPAGVDAPVDVKVPEVVF